MTGFGIDIGQVGALPGTLSGIGESITGAAGAISGAGQGEFGHARLNQAVSQLTELLHGYLSGLGRSTSGMADSLTSTVRAYAGTDSSNAGSLGGLAGGTAEATAEPGGPAWAAVPVQDFGAVSADLPPDSGTQGADGTGGPFGLGNSPFAE